MLTSEQRARRLTLWSVVAGAIAGALLTLAIAENLRNALWDSWQQLSPRQIAERNVSIVLIDALSLDAVGSWPWSRYYIARLTETIAQQNPKAIGFDMIFAEPDARDPDTFVSLYPELEAAAAQQVRALPSMDRVLAQVIGASPVVLARVGVEHDGASPAKLLVDPEIDGKPSPGTMRVPQVLSSIAPLDDVALAHAMVNGPPDDDGIVRRVPLNVVVGDKPMPGFATELARIAADVPQLEWQGAKLRLGDTALPADNRGSLALRFGHFPEAQVHSAAAVLAGQVPPDAFADRVVLIGLGAAGTADIVATPLDKNIYGIFVQAQAVDAILERDWLSRPLWMVAAEVGISLLLIALLLFAAATHRRWPTTLALVLALLLLPFSWLLFAQANLLFDPLRPLLITAFAALAMWAMRYALARSERAQLAAELVEQRVAASEQEGELRAARRIQLGMVPGPRALARLDPRIEVAAVLEPAKSVGGDFYDALMIGPDHMLFLIGDVTGKGVPAALYMALSKTLSKSVLSRAREDLGEAVATLNRDLMDEADEEMGLTMLVGIVDCSDGTISMVNAGHENPLAVRRDGSVETLTMQGGPPFCVIDFAYPVEQFALAPRESLAVITDGATEAQNAALELFGTEGVTAALESGGDVVADTRAKDLAARVRAFEGDTNPSDDLTIFVMRYLGPNGAS